MTIDQWTDLPLINYELVRGFHIVLTSPPWQDGDILDQRMAASELAREIQGNAFALRCLREKTLRLRKVEV